MAGRSRALLFTSRNTKRHKTPPRIGHFLAISEIGCTFFLYNFHSESGLYQRDEDPRGFFLSNKCPCPGGRILCPGVYRTQKWAKQTQTPKTQDAGPKGKQATDIEVCVCVVWVALHLRTP